MAYYVKKQSFWIQYQSNVNQQIIRIPLYQQKKKKKL